MQADWAVYTVPISGDPMRVHALMCELAYSRKIHARFYRNERQATLLEGLTLAFSAFHGVTTRVVFDNMATVVLGRIGSNGRPIWHPRFLDFARYYGFEPFACRVRDPDRKDYASYCTSWRTRGASFGKTPRSRSRLPWCAFGNGPAGSSNNMSPLSFARIARRRPSPAKFLAVEADTPSRAAI